jgi:hypothetical protein
MYLHIGNEFLIMGEDLVGIFDIESTTVSRDTKDFLNSAAKRKCDVSCTDDIPRSFVVSFDRKNLDEKVFVSRLSPGTIKKRFESDESF